MWIKQKGKNRFGEEAATLVWHEPKKAMAETPVTITPVPITITPMTYGGAMVVKKKRKGRNKQ